jgi:hypothetical protein
LRGLTLSAVSFQLSALGFDGFSYQLSVISYQSTAFVDLAAQRAAVSREPKAESFTGSRLSARSSTSGFSEKDQTNDVGHFQLTAATTKDRVSHHSVITTSNRLSCDLIDASVVKKPGLPNAVSEPRAWC